MKNDRLAVLQRVHHLIQTGQVRYICYALDGMLTGSSEWKDTVQAVRCDVLNSIAPHTSVEDYVRRNSITTGPKQWRLNLLKSMMIKEANKMSKPHKHAVLMAEYAADALKTDEPWKLWQVSDGGKWVGCLFHPKWHTDTDYRRKPKTVTQRFIYINEQELPAPVTEYVPGTQYWAPSFDGTTWNVSASEISSLLRHHRLFDSQEAAEKVSKALYELLAQEPVVREVEID